MYLNPALACSIEALCILLGNPELYLRRSPLFMDRHFKTTWSRLRTQLGACINIIELTLRIRDTKRADLVTIMSTTWNSSQKRFTLREEFSLLGLVSNLALTTQWVKCTFIALQQAISIALKFNSNIVFLSGKHKHLTDLLWPRHSNVRSFRLSKSYTTLWNLKEKVYHC